MANSTSKTDTEKTGSTAHQKTSTTPKKAASTTARAKKAVEAAPEVKNTVKPVVKKPTPKKPAITPGQTRTARPAATTSRRRKVNSRELESKVEELNLPPHVTSWEITPDPYNEEQDIITFYSDGVPLVYIEITVDNLEDVMNALNTAVIITGSTEVTNWSLRTPENPEFPTLLSLISNGAVVATLPLNEVVLKGLVPELNKLHKTEKLGWNNIAKWSGKHKISAGFLGILFGGMTVYGLYTVITNSLF